MHKPALLADRAVVWVLDFMSRGPACVCDRGRGGGRVLMTVHPVPPPHTLRPLSASSDQHTSGGGGHRNPSGVCVPSAAPGPVMSSLYPVFTTEETG